MVVPPGRRGIRLLFADDFAYNDGWADTTREDFLLLRESSGVIDEIKFIELQCHGSTASAMFEGTDGITHLRHRICWIITSEGDRIRRISACVGNILGPEERTVWK